MAAHDDAGAEVNLPPADANDDRRPRARLRRMIARRRALAHLVVLWEQLWPAVWPPAGVAGAWLALVLFDALPALPGWLHALVLAGFVVALVAALAGGLRRLVLPDDGAADRRLERDSGLDHCPLLVLADTLASPHDDPTARRLWQLHHARARAAVRRLRLIAPSPNLARRDPFALRLLVPLALGVGLLVGAGDAGDRMARAVQPDIGGFAAAPPATLELWVTPPDYTGLPPRLLTGRPPAEPGAAAPPVIAVPSGTTVLAQVHDGDGPPQLVFAETSHALAPVDDRSWRVEHTVEAGDGAPGMRRLAVEQAGATLGQWQLVVVPDNAPSIAFASEPSTTRRKVLRLEYALDDDYGVVRVIARVVRPSGEATQRDAALELSLPMSGTVMREGSMASFHDLTAHPWAGFAVELRLEATDALDQTGTSLTVDMVLPERDFRHPVAREIIAQRKALTRAPQARDRIGQEIARIARRPLAYNSDAAIFLALMSTRSLLLHNQSPAAIDAAQQRLWDTALRVEDGGLSLAERGLRELQRQLQEALARGADDAEIERLLDELRDAINRYFEALAQSIRRQLESGETLEFGEFDPESTLLNRDDLQRLIDQAQTLSRSGARDAARELLARLQEMLENLQLAPFARQGRQDGPAQQMMRQLQDIVRGQQNLLDQTFRQSQRGTRPPDGGAAGSAEQRRLRRQLGELMRQLGEMLGDIPGQFGGAERAMRQSEDALGRGQPGEAVGPQGQAIDMLRQGAQSAAQALARQRGRGDQLGLDEFGNGDEDRDPLGRPLPNSSGFDTGNVKVPDKGDLQRAREILDTLRRRAGERYRPQTELDYIERLLRRF